LLFQLEALLVTEEVSALGEEHRSGAGFSLDAWLEVVHPSADQLQ
jgi:hypothetical protein